MASPAVPEGVLRTPKRREMHGLPLFDRLLVNKVIK